MIYTYHKSVVLPGRELRIKVKSRLPQMPSAWGITMKLLRRSLCFAMLGFLLAGVSPADAQTQNYAFGRADLAADQQPLGIAAGDFNGDSRPDLVVANLAENTVSVFLGQADGTFGAKVDYASGMQPYSVTTGDFNGDGNLDIVVTNENCIEEITHLPEPPVCGPGSVSILLGNGDGTFQPQMEYATGVGPLSVKASDLNGDGKLDLVVVNGQDFTMSTLLGNGDGTFQAHVDYATPLQPSAAVVADFNNDGKPDIAVSSAAGVSVWLGNGDGTVGSRVDFQLRDQTGAASVAAGDFNRDGRQDLAVTDGAGTNIFLGNGDGTFTFQGVYPTGTGTIVAVDLNKDGKVDLAVVNAVAPNALANSFSVLLGNGDGTFQPPASYGAGSYPFGIAAGDFNGDGQVDLAVSNPQCPTVPWLMFPATTAAPCSAGSTTVVLGEGGGIFGGSPVGSSAVGTAPTFFLPADLNGDGKTDLVVVNQGDDTVSVLLGDGDGTFQPQTTFPTGHFPVSVQAGDFNGDGKVDLAVVDQICATKASSCTPGAVSILLGNGNGTFQPPTDFAVGLTPVSLVVGDFDGDGKLDLAAANNGLQLGSTVSVLLGKGDGTFTAAVNYVVPVAPIALRLGDFNKDGKLDLAVDGVNPQEVGTISILLGVGDGTFKPHMDFAGGNPVPSMTVGDFNNDGIADLAVGAAGLYGFSVFLSNGNGTFRAGQTVSTTAPNDVHFLASGDFNADGNLDLVFTSSDDPRVRIYRGNGDGTFQPEEAILISGFTTVLATADFDGDGGLDLAAFNGAVSTIPNPPFKGVSPNALAFGSRGVGTTSAVQTVTLANPSGAPFNITSIALGGDYSQTNTCGAKVMPGATCTISVRFNPTATGARTGAITLTDSTRSSPQVIPLTGSGVNGPFLELSSAHLLFAATAVGSMSAPQSVTLTNSGNAMLAAPSVGISGGNVGDFSETNACASGLAPGAACSVRVTFTPTAGGTRVAALTITSSAPGSPQTVSLTGTSPSPRVALGPASLTFSGQGTGTASAAQNVTLSNIGNAAVSISTISTSGDFAETNNCGASVAAGGTCQISVTFTPTATGVRTGMLTATDNASGSPQTVSLSGTALSSDVTLSPATLLFAAQVSGTTSAAQNVTLSNAGNAALSITTISTSGDFAETNKCGTSVAAGGACQISVTFTPTSGGSRTGTLTVADGASGSSQVVTLTGTGQDFLLASSGSASATVMPGQTATYTIALTPGGGLNPNVTLTCSGAPAGAACNISPATVSLNGTTAATATVTVTTKAASLVLLPDATKRWRHIKLVVLFLYGLALLLMAGFWRWRASPQVRWAPPLAMALLLCVALTLTSCGGGSSSGGGSSATGTAAGTYTITVSASATAGSTTLTHSTKLTLVVQ
jgi:FG-GAP-like repeat/Abnormal spindle-like microcephaly-assoc'd, ASPM-SPD-2-Hydin/FG-GAP repeat